MQKGLPYVTVKWAMSIDGKIATHTGDSRWITSEESREYVHKIRGQMDGIMVGINTVLRDDPLLTCRIKGEKSKKNSCRQQCLVALKLPPFEHNPRK